MIIEKKAGNLATCLTGDRLVDRVCVEWYETEKRILHKRTECGREIILKFLKENPALQQDDVLYQNENYLIVVEVLPCESLVVRPVDMLHMAMVCYEIGNKHLPLFLDKDEVLVPYEAPLFRSLAAAGFAPRREKRKLLHRLQTTVSPHNHSSVSLFTRVMQFTNSSPDA